MHASGSRPRSSAGCSTSSSTTTARTPRSRTSSTRVSCGSCSSRTRTATSTRSTTNGCGARTSATTTATDRSRNADGVDPNRNYNVDWGYDDEGSRRRSRADDLSRHRAGLGARGSGAPGADRPAEVQVPAHVPLVRAADPLPVRLAGPDAVGGRPALRGARRAPTRIRRSRGFDPGVGADLYITNGDDGRLLVREDRRALVDARARTRAATAAGSSSPTTRRSSRPSTRRTCRSRSTSRGRLRTRRNPVSHLGNTVKPFYLDMGKDGKFLRRPIREDEQPGERLHVLGLVRRPAAGARAREARPERGRNRRRGVGQVPDHAERRRAARADRADDAVERRRAYGEVGDFYYHVMQGDVTGTQPGDSVKVWFTGAGQASESFTYIGEGRVDEPRARAGGRGLHGHLAGVQVEPAPRVPVLLPRRAGRERLRGRRLRRRRERTQGSERRSASSRTTRRSIWYTGDDVITREPGMVPGTASRLANDEMLAVRAYLNEGGRLLYTGKYAGLADRAGLRVQPRDERAVRPRQRRRRLPGAVGRLPAVLPRRVPLQRGRGDDAEGHALRRDRRRQSVQLARLVVRRHRARTTRTPRRRSSRRAGSCPKAQFPQFESWVAAKYVRPGGPFDPHTGTYYAYSQHRGHQLQAPDADDQRPGRRRQPLVLDLARHRARLGLHVSSRRTRSARTTGRRCRTRTGTQARARGRTIPTWRAARPAGASFTRCSTTTRRSTATGRARRPARPVSGTPRAAAPAGWEQWSIDLGAYAGKQVEISIAYASDWSVQGLGAFVDDVTLSTGETRPSRRASTAGPSPARRPAARRTRTTGRATTAAGFPEGAVVATPDTIYMGFGFEGIADAAKRGTR